MSSIYNTPEQDLLRKIAPEIEAQLIVVSTDAEAYFNVLEEHFPLGGSKIAWSKVPGSCKEKINYDDELSVLTFFDVAMSALGQRASNKVIAVGDSAMEVALSASVEIMRRRLYDIISLPQHTYIVPPDVSWCLSYTMEGDMVYGRSPS
jgi:hypothetical protein